MNIASSVSYSSQQDFGEYSAAVTTLPEDYEFESEKINPNEKIGKSSPTIPTTTEAVDHRQIDYSTNTRINVTQQQQQQADQAPPSQGLEVPRPSSAAAAAANHHDKFTKLLFSSPSATVTSDGFNGPFKAIICHDCENSEGRNAGHSVSFSAIKSWNVGGKSKVQTVQIEPDSNRTTSITTSTHVKESAPHQTVSSEPAPSLPSLVEESDKYVDESQDEIEANDNVEILKVTTTPSVVAQTKKPNLPTKSWNFSSSWHLGGSKAHSNSAANNTPPRKPIFTDLLKYPYDVLNAPQAEPSTTTSSTTTTQQPAQPQQDPSINQQQIHINHQQKFNDSITSNYQHFQQFIHKNLNTNVQPPQGTHYQSTAQPEQNYEVDESVSLMSNGRVHGIQSTTTTTRIPADVSESGAAVAKVSHHHQQRYHSGNHDGDDHEQDAKFGYVVEGRNFRKYRVEEKTSDGFIVGWVVVKIK